MRTVVITDECEVARLVESHFSLVGKVINTCFASFYDRAQLESGASLALLYAARGWRREGPFAPYAFKVIKRYCLNMLRDERSRTRRTPEISLEELMVESSSLLRDCRTPESVVLEQFQTREEMILFKEALAQLSPTRRRIVELRFSGFEHEEIAAILTIPLGTVKSGLNRAVSTMRPYVQARSAP